MKLEGNYNFGVYNPPSGLDAVKYSQQASTELALQLNNLKVGQETGFKQDVAAILPKFSDMDISLINSFNNSDIELFTNMIRAGWGK